MGLLWFAFSAAYVTFFYVFHDAREIADSSLDGYLEVILLGVPSVVLLGVALWLRESEVERSIRPRVVGWTIAVAVLFVVAMNAALFVVETRFDQGEEWLILLLSVGIGASAGSVMGILDVRSIQRQRERNRSIREARRRERERERLEHLNQYLRHEVLNEVNKIHGYAGLLQEGSDSEGDRSEWIDVIRRSSAEVSEFVQSIRKILDAADHDPDLEPVDVTTMLEDEVDRLQRTRPSATIELDAPGPVHALADDLLCRAFSNLIENAIEHADGVVEIGIERRNESVRVSVRDDGLGIPESERESLFEPPAAGDHGYGLFLTRNLIELYGGRIDLVETGPEGTEFWVTLNAAQRPEPARTERPQIAPRA